VWERETKECLHCGASGQQRLLEQCVTCRQHFCRLCAIHRMGRRFCGIHCCDLFFFGGEEDEELDED